MLVEDIFPFHFLDLDEIKNVLFEVKVRDGVIHRKVERFSCTRNLRSLVSHIFNLEEFLKLEVCDFCYSGTKASTSLGQYVDLRAGDFSFAQFVEVVLCADSLARQSYSVDELLAKSWLLQLKSSFSFDLFKESAPRTVENFYANYPQTMKAASKLIAPLEVRNYCLLQKTLNFSTLKDFPETLEAFFLGLETDYSASGKFLLDVFEERFTSWQSDHQGKNFARELSYLESFRKTLANTQVEEVFFLIPGEISRLHQDLFPYFIIDKAAFKIENNLYRLEQNFAYLSIDDILSKFFAVGVSKANFPALILPVNNVNERVLRVAAAVLKNSDISPQEAYTLALAIEN